MTASVLSQPCLEPRAPYFDRYITLVPPGDLIATLAEQIETTMQLFGEVTEEQSSHRYAPGKWSLKQVTGHMADTERVMAYRALAIGRGEQAALPSFDQDQYVAGADFDSLSWDFLISDLRTARAATVSMLRTLTEAGWTRVGTSSGNPTSAKALAAVIAGHELWHHQAFLRDYRPGLAEQ